MALPTLKPRAQSPKPIQLYEYPQFSQVHVRSCWYML